MELEDRLIKTLAKAIEHILGQRTHQGHWGDVRCTSLALWAMSEILLSHHPLQDSLGVLQNELKRTGEWLDHQARKEEHGFSWESEAWDTALSIIALAFDHSYNERIVLSTHWLTYIKDKGTGVWYDEVWETTLTTIALLRSQVVHKGPVQKEEWSWINDVLKWIIAIPSKSTGEFVCPHYSGFLVWLLGEIKHSRAVKQISTSEFFQDFEKKAKEALQWLLSKLDDVDIDLWSPYTFSNSYIIIGISALKQPWDPKHLCRFVDWFEHQGPEGVFEDIEDASLAVLALSSIMEELKINKEKLLSEISDSLFPILSAKKKCFLGYSGRAASIAVDLKNYISEKLPIVSFTDWKIDFRIGRLLFDEIKKACEESQAAIFLITEDYEQDRSSRPFQRTSRDNIIFEVGYFAAKNGIENTILVVEGETSIPTDWSGILYISMPSRDNLDPVKERIVKALTDALHLYL